MRLSIICACAVLVAACGGAARADKSGSAVEHKVTLTLQMPDAGDVLGKRFAAEVARRSGGSVQMRIDRAGRYDSGDPAAEVRLAHALQAGTEDVGYLPARAWGADGNASMQALLAPFVVTSYPTAQAVASGPLAAQVLATLPKSVVGVALVPSQLRRVLANRAPVSVDAFQGLRVRVMDNPQVVAAFRALGAEPVEGLLAGDVWTAMHARRLDAAESSPSFVLENSYAGVARYLSSYALFPKYESIVLSARAWAKLDAGQRAAVRAAARDAVDAAATIVPRQDLAQLARLCRAGIRIATPTAAQLQALASAAAPASAGIAAGVLAALRAAPGAGPSALATALPRDCTAPAAAPVAKAGPKFPEGVYVTKDTVADFKRGNVINPDFRRDITYRTRFRAGRWYQTQSPNYPDQGPFSGTYTVNGDLVRFVMLHASGSLTTPETLRWSYFNKQLHFEIVDVADTASIVLYTAHPWRKVG